MISDGQHEHLFADISRLTAMPFPNLVYRVLAEEPARLETCWSRLRPGLVLVGAPTLRRRLAQLRPASAPCAQPHKLIGEKGQYLLGDVLDIYDSGNSCNAVLVKLLLSGSKGDSASSLVQHSSEKVIDMDGSLPPLLDLGAMTEATRDQILALARLIDPSGQIVPSLFRHFADDSELLSSITLTLELAIKNNALNDRFEEITEEATRIAAQWPLPVAPVVDPATRALLAPFVTTIPRMLAASSILRFAVLRRSSS